MAACYEGEHEFVFVSPTECATAGLGYTLKGRDRYHRVQKVVLPDKVGKSGLVLFAPVVKCDDKVARDALVVYGGNCPTRTGGMGLDHSKFNRCYRQLAEFFRDATLPFMLEGGIYDLAQATDAYDEHKRQKHDPPPYDPVPPCNPCLPSNSLITSPRAGGPYDL